MLDHLNLKATSYFIFSTVHVEIKLIRWERNLIPTFTDSLVRYNIKIGYCLKSINNKMLDRKQAYKCF